MQQFKVQKLAKSIAGTSFIALMSACHHTSSKSNEALPIHAGEYRQASLAPLAEKDLDLFASWIVGSWDNLEQVEKEIADGVEEENRRHRYAMQYTEIDLPHIDGKVFAIENYDDSRGFEGEMVRVSLHRFYLTEDKSEIQHQIMFFKDKAFRDNLKTDLAPLKGITLADLRSREECSLYWTWTGERFEGATRKGECVTNSYTDRDITVEGAGVLSSTMLSRHDRNFEMTGEEIARPGYETPEVFRKINRK